jgi:pimeloyl-ACP methyl ester carboxylesterase
MPLIRTPEDRFTNLPAYPFAPNYMEINQARVHYLDEGAGQPILCLHGEPTWSYLYRKMIPPLAALGRVIVPDLIGFGKSDKYAETAEYSFQMHHDSMMQFVQRLDLRDMTIVVQDWGGMIGLRLVAEMPESFLSQIDSYGQ